MIIQRMKINDIRPADYNPRIDLQPGDPEYEKLKKSIDRWDLVEPLVFNKRTGNLVGGHQRLKVLIDKGFEETDVSIVDLPIEEEKALNIALNKISGFWDITKLSEVLGELHAMDFDIDMTGFSSIKIQKMLGDDIDLDKFLSDEKKKEPKVKEAVCPKCGERFPI